MSWNVRLPESPAAAERPPYPARDFPIGTTAEKDGVVWYVVWDDQDKCHYWNDTPEDV